MNTRISSTQKKSSILVAFASMMATMSLFAGPMEDAKALYNGGKFAEVDDKLGSLLDKRPIPMEALELSFNASVKAGRPYTAERRYNAMVEKGDKIPSSVLFNAALVSGYIGKPNVRRDRLIFFLNSEKGWNEDVERALILLCRDGGDGDHYVRLMQKEPATEPFFDLGMDLLGQLRATKRTTDYIKVVDAMLQKWQDAGHMTRVIDHGATMMNEIGNAGFRSDLLSTMVKYPVGSNSAFLAVARGRQEFGAQHVIDYAYFQKKLLPIDLFRKITGLKGSVVDLKVREKYAPKFSAIRPIVMAEGVDPDYLQNYIGAILANPELFKNPGCPVLISQEDLATLFSKVATAKYVKDPESLRALANDCIFNKAWQPAHEAAIIKTYPKLFDYRALIYNTKLADQVRQEKNGAKLRELLAKIPDRIDVRAQALPVFFDVNDVQMMKTIAEEIILADPAEFKGDNIARYILCTTAMTTADKINFLNSVLTKVGYSASFKNIVTFGALPISLKEDASFKAFAESVKPEKKGTDPVAGAIVAISQMNNNPFPKEGFELAKKAIAALGNQIPNETSALKEAQSMALWRVMSAKCNSKDDKAALVNLFIRAFKKGADFQGLLNAATASQNQTNFVAVASAAVKSGAMSPDAFSTMNYPKAFPSSVLAPYYKDMNVYSAFEHVNRNAENGSWTEAEAIKQFGLLFASRPPEEFVLNNVERSLNRIEAIVSSTNSYNEAVLKSLEPLAVSYIDQRKGSSYIRSRVAKIFAMVGQRDAILARYVASADKADPICRYNDLRYVMDHAYYGKAYNNQWRSVVDLQKENTDPTSFEFGALLQTKLAPAMKAIPLKHAGLLPSYNCNNFSDRINSMVNRALNKQQSESMSLAVNDFAYEFGLRAPFGMKITSEAFRPFVLFRTAYSSFIKNKKHEEASRLAHMFGASVYVNWDWSAQNTLKVLNEGTKDGCWEPAHIAASAVSPDWVGNFMGSFQRLRADCSTHMPGIYPVDESSPLYPLYVAADELEKNNSERSWALLNKNIQTFEREAEKLPPNFVAWGVEQLRYARGKEDALLIKARQISSKLLGKETSLSPELAASLMLTKAECNRDQRNYEAAKLDYDSLRNKNEYLGTKAARKAMFRGVDLLIEIGNISQAEQIIEAWTSQPDAEVQAQAHYFAARIAFDRKDFEETRKQIEEVFNIDYTHTEARLLHGRWKLATNSEVDDTAVLVGDISDRTLIRPGQELTISVQDRNLGVAGGGNSIPIVITTSEGKDAEVLALYPSLRNPYLFSGSISTMLGVANPTNHILEVTGSDEVVYRVEPEFLAARGLETTEPKVLRVVDDARLAIGAAAPLAEEGKAEAALEAMIVSSSTEDGDRNTLSSNLKPGNPIYVVVRDRDRSLTINSDKITVDARTSSGDKLDGIVLEETEGTSGIFRGTIPTQLPPPRAFASDSAVGINPGDVINSKRNGLWKSASDGAQGKWFEVDTMASHVISNVAIMMPEGQNIKKIRLTGSLGDEITVLGAHPQTGKENRYGIHYQAMGGNTLNSSSLIRSLFSSGKAPKEKTINDLAFTPVSNRDQRQNAMISVPFVLPKDMTKINFRLEAKDLKGRTLAGLWMAIALDGVDVFSGQGNGLHDQLVTIDVTPGPHRLEFFFSANYPDDALAIHVEKDDGTRQQFPQAWTDPKVYPALETFVSDVATIHKTKGGYQATFSRPMRLRSLRWEFLEYEGRELSVQKLYVQDNRGKLIIPVESDYSDAISNEFLEVAPGDTITVAYNDDRTSNGEKRILEKTMTSSFHDAKVNFFFEEIEQTRDGNKMFLYDAYRFIPGDMLLVSVLDPDGDVTPDADKVKVTIETKSGTRVGLTLTERNSHYYNFARPGYGGADEEGIHGGHFMAQLRTCDASDTNAPPNVLRISKGDVITVTYLDKENTKPGIPTPRKVSVMATQPSKPQLTFFDTTVERVVDTSVDAKLRLEQIRRRPGNERIDKLYKDVVKAVAIPRERLSLTNDIPHNVMTSIPIMIVDPSRARHEASKVNLEVVAESELEDAEATGRDPESITIPLSLGVNFPGMQTDIKGSRGQTAGLIGQFSGLVKLHLGPPDPGIEYDENAIPDLPVNGNDRVRIRVLNDDGSVQSEHFLKLVSAARLGLMDSTYTADRMMAHVGERFFVMVHDPDQDDGENLNEVAVGVHAVGSKVTRKVMLRETMPHSGLFTGTIRPVIFAPGEAIPAVATGGVAVTEEQLMDDRISVRYGDTVEFVYNDKTTIPSLNPGLLKITGKVFKGSDGDVRLFSKHFRDSDMAVLVQFRLAECLFETAKEFRRLKQPERSAEAIDEGKHILEEALRNYPTTIHLVQGEYLLANLYQELATEEKEAKNEKAADALYSEALSRFSAILSTWPESEFAAKAQYHKALCLEMLRDYNRAGEEYVKMTYLYPESPLVGDASIRLATFYYKQMKFDTAGRIYANFQKRFPNHEKADRALFMSGQCHMKQAEYLGKVAEEEGKKPPVLLQNEEYKLAVEALALLTEQYRDTASVSLKSQAMYWAGDASLRASNYQDAYLYLKRTVFEFPETEWARRARGLLLQEAKTFEKLE